MVNAGWFPLRGGSLDWLIRRGLAIAAGLFCFLAAAQKKYTIIFVLLKSIMYL
jgi:hypothetical protein